MKKVKFSFQATTMRQPVQQIVEYDDDVTDEEIEQDFATWLSEQTDGYWGVVEE